MPRQYETIRPRALVTALKSGCLVSISFLPADRNSPSAPKVWAALGLLFRGQRLAGTEPGKREADSRGQGPQPLSGRGVGVRGGFVQKRCHARRVSVRLGE